MLYPSVVFRMKARAALKGHWQTALLVALIVNLPTLLMQGFSAYTGNDLITRLQDTKDKRKTLLYLTDKAHELKQDYDSVSLRMGQIYYQGFSEEEIVRFEGYLDRISRNLEGWRDE